MNSGMIRKMKMEILSITEKMDNIIASAENQLHKMNVFNQFKELLESYEHLGDVDKLWVDSLKIREELASVNTDIEDINALAKKQLQAIETLNQFKSILEDFEHLRSIRCLVGSI